MIEYPIATEASRRDAVMLIALYADQVERGHRPRVAAVRAIALLTAGDAVGALCEALRCMPEHLGPGERSFVYAANVFRTTEALADRALALVEEAEKLK